MKRLVISCAFFATALFAQPCDDRILTSSSPAPYNAVNCIAADSGFSASGSVTFTAGEYIHLGYGFHALPSFHASVAAPAPPSVVSVTPANGTGSQQTFSFVASDPNGGADISGLQLLFANTSGADSGYANACDFWIDRPSKGIWLRQDTGGTWYWDTPRTLGVAGQQLLGNPQCTLDPGASSIVWSGVNLTVNLALTFTPAFTGTHNITMEVVDSTHLPAGALPTTMTQYTVSFTQPSLSLAITPGSQTVAPGGSTSYTVTVTGANGFGGNVNLSAPALPSGASASFNPVSVSCPTNGSATSTMTIYTTSGVQSGNFVVMGTSSGPSNTASATLAVSSQPLAITTSSPLPNGTTQGSYWQPLDATGGVPGYTWSVASGSSLPAGLSLTNGALSGTPAAVGTYNFWLQVGDATSQTASKYFSLAVLAQVQCSINAHVLKGAMRTGSNTLDGYVYAYGDNIIGSWTALVGGYLWRQTAGGNSKALVASGSASGAVVSSLEQDNANPHWRYTVTLAQFGNATYFTGGVGQFSCAGAPVGSVAYAESPLQTITRPARPDYAPGGGPVMFLGTGIASTFTGTYHASTDVVPGNPNGALGTPQWILVQSSSGFGTLSCTNCASTAFTATRASEGCQVFNVQIKTNYGGFTSDPFYVFINAPNKTDLPSSTTDAFFDGYSTTISYVVRDLCEGSMIGFDATESFEGDKMSDYTPADNWPSGDPGGHYFSGTTIKDSIDSCTSMLTCFPIPERPSIFPGTVKVHHRPQTLYVGSQDPGQGVPIQTDCLQRWLDHATHENIVTPSSKGTGSQCPPVP